MFQRSVTLQPDDPRERRLLAAVQLMAGKPQEAIETLTPLLERPGPDAETLSLASAAYEKSGDTPRAVSTLRQAILLDPKNVNLYLDFATIAFAHQSFQAGVEVLNDGIGLHPTAPLYVARGVLYVQLADYDKAEADFDKANELDPSQALSAAAQGLAAAQANDLDRALATIEAQLARKPNDAYLLYLQADILAQKGPEPGTPISTGRWRRRRKRSHYSRRLAPHAECLQNCSYRPGIRRGDRAVQKGVGERPERSDGAVPVDTGAPQVGQPSGDSRFAQTACVASRRSGAGRKRPLPLQARRRRGT